MMKKPPLKTVFCASVADGIDGCLLYSFFPPVNIPFLLQIIIFGGMTLTH